MKDLPLTSNPKETRLDRAQAYRRMRASARAIRNVQELDAVLDADANLNIQPETKALVRQRIQDACPWLRDTVN